MPQESTQAGKYDQDIEPRPGALKRILGVVLASGGKLRERAGGAPKGPAERGLFTDERLCTRKGNNRTVNANNR